MYTSIEINYYKAWDIIMSMTQQRSNIKPYTQPWFCVHSYDLRTDKITKDIDPKKWKLNITSPSYWYVRRVNGQCLVRTTKHGDPHGYLDIADILNKTTIRRFYVHGEYNGNIWVGEVYIPDQTTPQQNYNQIKVNVLSINYLQQFDGLGNVIRRRGEEITRLQTQKIQTPYYHAIRYLGAKIHPHSQAYTSALILKQCMEAIPEQIYHKWVPCLIPFIVKDKIYTANQIARNLRVSWFRVYGRDYEAIILKDVRTFYTYRGKGKEKWQQPTDYLTFTAIIEDLDQWELYREEE